MSLTINCYKNLSDRRKAAKELELIETKTAELKGDVNIVSPVLILTGDAATYAECNYIEIPAFNRYYFAEFTANPGGILTATCNCDVLSSAWAHGLQDLQAVVARQQEEFNLYLNDGTFQAYANDQVVTKEFSAGFSTPAYVLVVAG